MNIILLSVTCWLTLTFLHSLAQTTFSAEVEEKPLVIVPLTMVGKIWKMKNIFLEFIALLEDESRYNKYATPTQDKGIATNVSMSMFIEGISSFSAQTMDYQMDMYFYQEWKDERLKHNGSGPLLVRDKAIFKKLWHPDIYFANARQASFQEITEDNFMVWIYPNGRVWYDCRISLVAICMMDLWKYPLDSQMCELRILSYAYPESHLRLRWSKRIQPPIDRNPDIKMPDMRLVDIKTGECNGTYATGVWSCMTAIFFVEREMLHHVIQTYVPTALIVVISWFNFWLDIDAAPARVTLSITTLLTIATQANAVKLALPEVSYMKAIDAWMGMCMAFVFAVMVEYTLAHFAKNQELPIFPVTQPPLVVDSETLHSIFNAAANNNNNNQLHRTESELAAQQHELQGFITSEQLHRHWRKRVCGVLSNGRLSSMSGSHKKEKVGVRGSSSTRSIRSNKDPKIDVECAVGTGDNDSEVSSSTDREREERLKLSKNHLSAEMFCMEDPRLKRLSRSLPEHFNMEPEPIVEQVQRKNSFRESARVIRNQIIKLLKLNERAQFIKRTLGQLRGREMANKIDQKSRILFPLAFIIMNICYWSYYLVLN